MKREFVAEMEKLQHEQYIRRSGKYCSQKAGSNSSLQDWLLQAATSESGGDKAGDGTRASGDGQTMLEK